MDVEGFSIEGGHIVRLVTGGPEMAVLAACEECGEVTVAWFNGDALEIATLPDYVLEVE